MMTRHEAEKQRAELDLQEGGPAPAGVRGIYDRAMFDSMKFEELVTAIAEEAASYGELSAPSIAAIWAEIRTRWAAAMADHPSRWRNHLDLVRPERTARFARQAWAEAPNTAGRSSD